MLSRDYILRLLRDFTEALEKLLEKKKKMEGSTFEVSLQSMYNAYFHHIPEYYYDHDADFIISELGQEYKGTDFVTRLEMLSELMYQDALCKQSEEQKYLLSKTLHIFEFIDKNSDTFSFERRAKMNKIRTKISF